MIWRMIKMPTDIDFDINEWWEETAVELQELFKILNKELEETE